MKQWYKITAKTNRAEILIYEQIGQNWFDEGISAKKFVTELNALDVEIIDLYINSPGGNVFEGNSIYNALVRHKAKINVTIDGVAASIASVIAMAGNTITMPENALMMIHDPSALVMGTSSDMARMIKALDRIKVGFISAYQTHTDKSEDEIDEMMQNETWMTASEAVEAGFATDMIEPVKMAANFEAFKYFNNVPESLRVLGQSNSTKEADKMPKINLELIKNEHPEIVSEILAGVDIDYIRENLPDVVDKLKSESRAEGAEAERNRIMAVKEQSMSGHEKLIDKLMFDGTTTGEQAAVKVLQAEKQIRAQMSADLKKDAPEMIEQPATDNLESGDDDHLPIDKRCEARWQKSKELQAEFMGDFDSYLAYETAISAGKAKVLNK